MSEKTQKLRHELRPWAGLIGGAVAALGQHQVGMLLGQESCGSGNALISGGTGIVALIVAAGAGWLSFGIWRASDADLTAPEAGSRRFIAGVSAMAAGFFLLLIVAQTLSGFIIPGCQG